MSIRPARPSDFHAAARLIRSALDEITSYFSGEEDREDNPERFVWLENWFQQTRNRFSYQQVLVKEVEDQVVGAMITYHGSEVEKLDRPINAYIRRVRNEPAYTLEREAELDEFYIDALGVSPAFSGRGYATALIRAAEERAQERHSPKIALIIDVHNERAYSIYQHLGYRTDKERTLYGTPVFHMVKHL
jgi:ribosomal protein S18 acetylase RimI-like enzyme